MPFNLYIGFDTGCDKLNWHNLNDQEVDCGSGEIDNSTDEITPWAEALLKEHCAKAGDVMICIENTGVYSLRLAYELNDLGFGVWVQDALEINKSIGRVKTKNDKLDAFRIARYALRNRADYLKFVPATELLSSIKSLIGQRKRLMKAKNMIGVPIGEEGKYFPFEMDDEIYTETKKLVVDMKKAIKAIDKKLHKLIHQDERYSRSMSILKSLPGLGEVTARHMVVKTANFSRGFMAKKLASLFGVSPHERESGKVLKRKPKTHPNVDKEVKSCLHMGMLRHTQSDNKLGKYYRRKIAEGKHHSSVINAMANITIGIACACLKNDVMYDENYQVSLHTS